MRGRLLPLLLVAALAGALALWITLKPNALGDALRSRETATRVLAENLARKFPKDRMVVASNPFTKKKGQLRHVYQYEDAGLRGLRKGFGEGKVVVDFPELQPGAFDNPHGFTIPANTTTPVAFLLAQGAFDALAQKHPGCGVVVSLIGIPTDLTTLKLWQSPDGPKLAFLLPDMWMLGDKQAIASAFKTGKIAAMVVKKPGVSLEGERESAKDFTKGYLLLTPDNMEEMMANYPQLFD